MNDDSTQAMLDTVEAFKDRLNEKEKAKPTRLTNAAVPVLCMVIGVLIGAGVTFATLDTSSDEGDSQRLPNSVFDWVVLEVAAHRDILPQAARRLLMEKIHQAR